MCSSKKQKSVIPSTAKNICRCVEFHLKVLTKTFFWQWSLTFLWTVFILLAAKPNEVFRLLQSKPPRSSHSICGKFACTLCLLSIILHPKHAIEFNIFQCKLMLMQKSTSYWYEQNKHAVKRTLTFKPNQIRNRPS